MAEGIEISAHEKKVSGLRSTIAERGYAHLDAASFRGLTGITDLAKFQSFAELWGDLEPDTFMADGGPIAVAGTAPSNFVELRRTACPTARIFRVAPTTR